MEISGWFESLLLQEHCPKILFIGTAMLSEYSPTTIASFFLEKIHTKPLQLTKKIC